MEKEEAGGSCSLLRIVEVSHPEVFPAVEAGKAKDIYAEAWVLSEARWWARRAKYEGFAYVIAATAQRAQAGGSSCVARDAGGLRRGFTVYIKKIKGDEDA
jgi:hypothetical protein